MKIYKKKSPLILYSVSIIFVYILTYNYNSQAEELKNEPAKSSYNNPSIIKLIDFPKAESISTANSIKGVIYVLIGQSHSLFLSSSNNDGETFSTPVKANGDIKAHVMGVERPALSVSENGDIGIAWLEISQNFNGGNIWYTHSEDGGRTFGEARLVSNELSGEIAMVEITLDTKGNPIIIWLNDSNLRFSHSFDKGINFSKSKNIGDSSCECCQPNIAVTNDNIYISYRSLESGSTKDDIRDIVLIQSQDLGKTFNSVTRVSDTNWYLSACPIAGPSMKIFEINIYIAWMDGRLSPRHTFKRGDIWFSLSNDNGKSFMKNIRINQDQTLHHTKPTIAVGQKGKIYLVWEAHGENDNMLYYSVSSDSGRKFSPEKIIIKSKDNLSGRPQMPLLNINKSGKINLAWIDNLGAHIALLIDM